MERRVEPEWLDALPPDDPGAVASRHDLERINLLMGNADILARLLQSSSDPQPPRRLVELGAGDGKFMLRLAQSLAPRWKKVQVLLVDTRDAVASETRAGFTALGWTPVGVTADVFEWLRRPMNEPMDIMVSNLFLHHFSVPQLAELLRLAAERTRVFAACEPRRSSMALAFSKLVGLIGCNAVTRHDAVVSVRAGFTDTELSHLWPTEPQWRVREQSARLFTHAFIAEKAWPNNPSP